MSVNDLPADQTDVRASANWQNLLLVGMLAGSAYLLANLLGMPFGRDQAVFAVAAETVANGGALYRDVWDVKPPGVFLLYLLGHSVFGATELGIRIFEIFSMLLFGGIAYYITKRNLPVAAAVICFTIAVHNLLLGGYWNTAQTESFGAVFVLAGIMFGLNRAGSQYKKLFLWACCSACFAFAGMLKPTLAAGVVVSFLAVVHWEMRRVGWTGVILPLLAFFVGATAVTGLVVCYLWLSGALPAFLETMLVFVPQYTQLAHERDLVDLITRTLVGYFGTWIFVLPGLALLFLLGWKDKPLMGDSVHLVIQIAVLLFGVALQGKFYPYHFMSAALVAAVPAGWGFWLLLRKLLAYRIGVFAFCCLFAFLMIGNYKSRLMWGDNIRRIQAVMGTPEERFAIETEMYRVHTVDSAANRGAAEWLAQNKPSNDATLLVFGFEPIIYRYSGLNHFTRYIYSVPLKAPWSKQDAEKELLEAFSDPPWAVVVQSSDRLPQMTGDSRDSRAFMQAEMPELLAVLGTDYDLVRTFGPLDVFVLKTDS